MDSSVVACIPYHRCRRYIRRAVESLLTQTHRRVIVVVLNDADYETPPWPALADIDDPRLVRFDLAKNRGPYFATQVVLAATKAPYLLIQDSDDWSHPERIERLLAALKRDKADFALSATPMIHEEADGSNNVFDVRWSRIAPDNRMPGFNETFNKFQVDTTITAEFRYRAPHVGLYRTSTLHNIGGYYGGFKMSYDTFLTNLILMTGKITHVPEPLYYWLVRPTSLSNCMETGMRSVQRKIAKAKIAELYGTSYKFYQAFLAGHITSSNMTQRIRLICRRHITPEDKQAIYFESQRLKQYLPKL
jgi:glycosyltransferase involved in cell wall biosynthesis